MGTRWSSQAGGAVGKRVALFFAKRVSGARMTLTRPMAQMAELCHGKPLLLPGRPTGPASLSLSLSGRGKEFLTTTAAT